MSDQEYFSGYGDAGESGKAQRIGSEKDKIKAEDIPKVHAKLEEALPVFLEKRAAEFGLNGVEGFREYVLSLMKEFAASGIKQHNMAIDLNIGGNFHATRIEYDNERSYAGGLAKVACLSFEGAPYNLDNAAADKLVGRIIGAVGGILQNNFHIIMPNFVPRASLEGRVRGGGDAPFIKTWGTFGGE